MITRRRLLWSGAASLAAGIAYPTLLEPRWLAETHTRISLAAPSRATVRILHLSDLHASWAVPLSLIDSAIEMGLAAQPDLVCITGDFITSHSDFDGRAYAKTLRRLSAARPTFASLGNHDGGPWARRRGGHSNHSVVGRLLDDAGITLLYNRAQTVETQHGGLTLVGLADLWSHDLDGFKAFRTADSSKPVVLLSHNPDSKEVLHSFPWKLMLCGHTHGGQVVVPFEGPIYAPVADKRFIAGLYRWSGRQMYISRGVGNIDSVRFMCRPEVAILDVAIG
ncbi:MAG: phosphodiesterase YaeI [Ignavibacteriota bacterium]